MDIPPISPEPRQSPSPNTTPALQPTSPKKSEKRKHAGFPNNFPMPHPSVSSPPPLSGTASLLQASLPGTVKTQSTETSKAIGKLIQIRQRFQTLLDRNWATDQNSSVFDGDFDQAMLPTIIAAENARTPGSPLVVLDSPHDLKTWLSDANFPCEGKRALFTLPLDSITHFVAADARIIDGKTSLIVIDPLTPTSDRARMFHQVLHSALKQCIADDITLTMFELGTQKARVGCHIFALSAASKLADQKKMMEVLHRHICQRQPLKTLLGKYATPMAGDMQIRLYNGQGVFPPDFMKHSQSGTTLRNWLQASPPAYADATLNKQNQTLMSRYEAHQTERYRQPGTQTYEQVQDGHHALPRDWTELLRTSTSIEHKRLVYIDRAIAYLRTAPPSESVALLERLHALDSIRHAVDDLGLDKRQIGPHLSSTSSQTP